MRLLVLEIVSLYVARIYGDFWCFSFFAIFCNISHFWVVFLEKSGDILEFLGVLKKIFLTVNQLFWRFFGKGFF